MVSRLNKITYNLLGDFLKNHAGHVGLQASESRNAVYRELLAQNRLAVGTQLQSLLLSQDAALLNQRRRRNEIVLRLVNASLEREVPQNRHIANHRVEVARALAPLRLLEVIIGEFGDGGEDPDYVLGASVDVLDMILVNSLHLL